MAPKQKRTANGGDGKVPNKKAKVFKNDAQINVTVTDVEEASSEVEHNSDEETSITFPELGDWKPLGEKVAQAEKIAKANRDNAITMKREVNEQQESLLATIAQQKLKINADRQAFEDGIWPLLTSAIVPFLTVGSPAFDSRPIPVSQTIYEETQFYKFSVEVLAKSGNLVQLLDMYDKRTLPPSRIAEFRRSFDRDTTAVLSSIHAGKKVAATDIQRRLAKQEISGVARQSISEEDEKKGLTLMSWGSEGADTSVVHDSALGEITAGLTKAVSKLEKLAHLE